VKIKVALSVHPKAMVNTKHDIIYTKINLSLLSILKLLRHPTAFLLCIEEAASELLHELHCEPQSFG